MKIVAEFDPNAIAGDSFSVPQSAGNGKIVVWNESNVSLQFNFQNGGSSYVPAWTARLYCPQSTNVTITWQQHTQLTQNNPPISQVIVEAYDQGEAVPGTFPMSLAARANNIGNTIPVASSATNVQDDGRIAGSLTIESTVSGDSTSASTLTNSGILTLGNTAGRSGAIDMPAGVDIYQTTDGDTLTTSGANTFLKARTGHVYLESVSSQHDVDVSNGQMTVNGNANITGTLTVGSFAPTSFNGVKLDVPGGQGVQVGSASNGDCIDQTSTDIYVKAENGGLAFQSPNGTTRWTLSRMNKFTGTGSGNFNHGLGVTPDIILCNPCTNNLSSQTIGFGNRNSTQVTVTTGAGLSWEALAIKF